MNSPQLNPEINKVLDELTHIWFSGERNEFAIQRCSRTVKKLISGNSGDLALNFMARGFLAAIEGNRDAAYSDFENALRLDSMNRRILINYSAIASSLGDIRKSLEMNRSTVEMFRDDASILTLVGRSFIVAFQLSEAISIADNILKLSANQDDSRAEAIVAFANSLLNGIKRAGLDESAMLERLEFVVGVVRMKYNINNLRLIPVSVDEAIYEIYINADIEACALMNFAIADHLVDKFENTGATVVSFMCFPLSSMQFNENSGI